MDYTFGPSPKYRLVKPSIDRTALNLPRNSAMASCNLSSCDTAKLSYLLKVSYSEQKHISCTRPMRFKGGYDRAYFDAGGLVQGPVKLANDNDSN